MENQATKNSQEFFKQNKYIYLSEVLNKDQCKHLSDHMHELQKQGELKQDEQCPLSWSIYGDPTFDSLLANLAKPIGEKIGLELIPTYTYARIYQPGEVLAKHTDRDSCEISGTLTIDHDPDSQIWPIFFGKNIEDPGQMYKIDVGDLVMYRGNELVHWRPKYKGKWQVQVFFHYVDANGPNKEWAYDKKSERKEFLENSNNKDVQITEDNSEPFKYVCNPNSMAIHPHHQSLPGYCVFFSKFKKQHAFTVEECNKIIDIASNQYAAKAAIGNGKTSTQNLKVRNVDNYYIFLNEDTRWIYNKIMFATAMANHEHFQYNIAGIVHELQLLHYRSDDGQGHYDWHVDIGDGNSANRKISMSVMLSPEDKYKGGDLEINDHGVVRLGVKEQGSINMFPSYMPHRVTPVTEGERWALVIWINGSDRFK